MLEPAHALENAWNFESKFMFLFCEMLDAMLRAAAVSDLQSVGEF